MCFEDYEEGEYRVKRNGGDGTGDDSNVRGEQEDEAPGVGTGGTWNAAERDALKRLILQFGVPGRWEMIRETSKISDKLLYNASNVELQSYSISFVKALYECLCNCHENKKVDPQDVIDL